MAFLTELQEWREGKMRFLRVMLAPEEVKEQKEIDKKLSGQEYWRMIDVWLYCVLRRHGINTVSKGAWSIHEDNIQFGPLPEEAEII